MPAAPKCSYFGVCGGCVYQNLSYPEQLELKRRLIEETLALDVILRPKAEESKILRYRLPAGRQAQNDKTVLPAIPSPKPYHYRHTISLTVKKREGMLRFGFTGKNGRGFVPIDSCAIADERLNQYIPEALRRLHELPEKKRYHTSQIALRVGDGGFVVTTLRSDRGKTLECTVKGRRFSYAVSSFFQHNGSVLDAFAEAVSGLLAPNGNETLLDLYSGVGLFSVLLAPFYRKVIGIEEGYEAVRHAKENAARNGVMNAEFIEGKAEIKLPELTRKWKGPLHVIVDPPRAGLKREVTEVLNRLAIGKLVYISCNLESFKRDLEFLSESFEVETVQPVDLFPQTKHIETIVLLMKK